MNIILNTPLPAVSKHDYDNKILLVFLIFMVFLTSLGLLFINVSRELSKTAPSQSINKRSHPSQQVGEYV